MFPWRMHRAPRVIRPLAALVVLVLGFVGLALANPAHACACFGDLRWGPNGAVAALAAGDAGGVYVGGSFDHWGLQTGGLAAVRASSGDVVSTGTMPRVDGTVYAIEPDGSGGYFIGGDFDFVNGYDRSNLAHVDSAGDVTDWAPLTSHLYAQSSAVHALLVHEGVVYVGGAFDEVSDDAGANYSTRSMLAAFDATTGALESWAPDLVATPATPWDEWSPEVDAFALDGSVLYVVGNFHELSTPAATRNGAAAFDLDALQTNSGLLGWDPDPSGPVFDVLVRASGVVLGGYFDSVSDGSGGRDLVTSVAEVWPEAGGAANDGRLTSFNAEVTDGAGPGEVYALASHGTDLLIGGSFDHVNGTARTDLAEVAANDAVLNWNPAPNSDVLDIVAEGATITIAGYFTQVGATQVARAARFDFPANDLPANDVPTSWDAGLDAPAETLLDTGEVILLGGQFKVANSSSVHHLVLLDSTGLLDSGFTAPAWDFTQVDSLLYLDGVVLVAGLDEYDQHAPGWPAWVDEIDAATGQTQLPDLVQTNGPISSMAYVNHGAYESLVIGGSFSSVRDLDNTEARSDAAAVHLYSGQVEPWAPAFPGPVSDLYADSDWVYAVGEGPQIGSYISGAPYALRAPDDTSGAGTLDYWAPDFSEEGNAVYGTASSVGPWGDSIAIGGRMLHSTSAQDSGSSLDVVSASDASEVVRSGLLGRPRIYDTLETAAGLVVAGSGMFEVAGGSPASPGVAALAGPDRSLAWAPNAEGAVSAVVAVGDTLVAGGSFTQSSGGLATSPHAYLAFLPVPVTPDDGGGGGGGTSGGGDLVTEVSAPAAAVPAATPAHPNPGPDTSLQLRPGEVAMLVDSARVPVAAAPNAANTALVVSGEGTSVAIPSPGGLGAAGAPDWTGGQAYDLPIDGVSAGSQASAYLLSTPRRLGTATAGPAGRAVIAAQVPASMPTGGHTLQVSGTDAAGRTFLIAVGVEVGGSKSVHGTRVFFGRGSASLTPAAKSALRALVRQDHRAGTGRGTALVEGVVRSPGASAAERTLARERSRAVAAYLHSSGYAGTVRVALAPRPAQDRWTDRRVQVTLR